MRKKIEYCIRMVILFIAVALITNDTNSIWGGLAMAADPWRSKITGSIKEDPSDGLIYVLIVETLVTAVLYFKILPGIMI
jgi:hypothetical protein